MNPFKLIFPTSVCLMILLVSSAGAAPSISLSSFANYHLSATTANIQDCTSANVTIAAFGCASQLSALVNINGDGVCTQNDTRCSFSPSSISVTVGMVVTWHDVGNIYHDIVSNSTADPASLPSFNLYIYQNSYTSQQFLVPGTYHYYDSDHPYLKGTVIVTQGVPPPPVITAFGADGSIGWNVAGLDQNDALLGVQHAINVYDQTTTPQTLVSNDSGAIEQYVDLGTREESPTSFSFLQSLPFGFSYQGFLGGFGPGFGGYGYPPYGYPGPYNNFQQYRTLWWVNGPLDNGSVVELLSGHASVTGIKSIQSPFSLGSQAAWSVTMLYSDNSVQTQPAPQNNFYYNYYCPGFYYGGPQPQPQCFTSKSSISVSLSADYAQRSDLLLGASATISTMTETTTNYPAGTTVFNNNNGYGYGGGGITVTSPVSIVRTTTSKVTFTLSISNTNVDSTKRMALQVSQTTGSTGGNPANAPSQTANQPLRTTIEYFLAGLGTAAIISGILWATIRGRRKPVVSNLPVSPATGR